MNARQSINMAYHSGEWHNITVTLNHVSDGLLSIADRLKSGKLTSNDAAKRLKEIAMGLGDGG